MEVKKLKRTTIYTIEFTSLGSGRGGAFRGIWKTPLNSGKFSSRVFFRAQFFPEEEEEEEEVRTSAPKIKHSVSIISRDYSTGEEKEGKRGMEAWVESFDEEPRGFAESSSLLGVLVIALTKSSKFRRGRNSR